MKKILYAVALLAAVAGMSACGGKESAAVKENEKDLKAKIENCTNPDSLSVYVDQAKAYAQQLVQEGKVDEAKKYLDQLEPVVKDKAPSLAASFTAVKTAVDKLPSNPADSAKCAAEVAADSVKAKGEDLKNAAAETVNSAATAASEKVSETGEKVKGAASDAADKASDAIKNALK